MVRFTTTIQQFQDQGEKTGWTYIQVPVDIAQQLKPGNKKSFRVKGKLDNYAIKGVALIPMGGGLFIMALNAAMRKGMGKRKGAMVEVQLSIDNKQQQVNAELLECLADEPAALSFFKTLAPSHQLYFSKWIESAKTEQTRSKRIAQAVTGLSRRMDYGAMIRFFRDQKD